MKDKEYAAIKALLEEAERGDFYGEITFRFRNGKIYNILKGQSLMLEDLIEKL